MLEQYLEQIQIDETDKMINEMPIPPAAKAIIKKKLLNLRAQRAKALDDIKGKAQELVKSQQYAKQSKTGIANISKRKADLKKQYTDTIAQYKKKETDMIRMVAQAHA